MKREMVIILIFILLVSSPLSISADYVTHIGNCSINWTKGNIISMERSEMIVGEMGVPIDSNNRNIISINRARVNAYFNAREKAIINIIEVIKSIRINSKKLIKDLIRADRFTQRSLSMLILNSIIEKEYIHDFFTTHCKIMLKISDIIESLNYEFPSCNFPLRDDIPISTFYSGLIIDGRGLDIKPMIFPSIYSEDGLEIYGRFYVDSKYAIKHRMTSYCYTEDEALNIKRAGDHPYFTIALNAINGCPVISERDVRKIFSDKNTINNLKRCRVIFILDR